METILDSNDVKKCIENEEMDPNEEFQRQDKKCIANSHLEYVKNKKTA